MSSSSISRPRSLRKPLINNNNINTNNGSSGSSGPGVIDGAAAGFNARDGSGPTSRTLSPTRLPVKGGASSSLPRGASTRAVSTASSTSTTRAEGGASSTTTTTTRKTRPLSGILGRSRQESVSKEKEDKTTTTTSSASGDVLNSKPPRTATTRVAIGGTGPGQSRPPSSSGSLTRSNSMARPTTSSGVPTSTSRTTRAPSGHARTKSSITTLTGATTLRPPSQTSADSGGSSAGTSADRSRPPITRSAAATHRRNLSNASSNAPSSRTLPTASKPPPTTSISTSRHSPTSTDPLPTATAAEHHNPHRPAFTTHQQHYSPAKSLAPKPLTSTFLAPPSPSKLPSNVALSAEIARLQTELLQLHLLHRDSHTVDSQWRSSARTKLGERFTKLVKAENQVGKLEESIVEMRNLKALVDWGASPGAEGLENRIQMLDEVICGVWSIGEPGTGRYTRVVRRFEKWMGRVKEVSEARKLFDRIRMGEGDGEKITAELIANEGLADLLLMGSATATGESNIQGKTKGGQVHLDAEWKEECAMLTRRLSEWRRILNGLMVIPTDQTEQGQHDDTAGEEETSSLARILKACSSLVDDMLAELKIMEQTERDAVAAENAWVRAVNRDQDEHGESLRPQRGASNNTGAGAIWRAF
ncbi:hypothetical protein V8F20_004546 [Naviculisporaceae sp. PSN 640]